MVSIFAKELRQVIILIKLVCIQNEVPMSLAAMGLKIGDQVCIGGNKVQIPS